MNPVFILNMYDTLTGLIIQIRNATRMLLFWKDLLKESDIEIRYGK